MRVVTPPNRRHRTLALQQIIQPEPTLKRFHSFIDLFHIIINLKSKKSRCPNGLFIKMLSSPAQSDKLFYLLPTFSCDYNFF
jgi:hypothetical protein